MKYTILTDEMIRINKTGEIVSKATHPTEFAKIRKRALTNHNKALRDDLLRSFGLTKVRGAVSGKIYYE